MIDQPLRILVGGPSRATGAPHEAAWAYALKYLDGATFARSTNPADLLNYVIKIDFLVIPADGEGYEVPAESDDETAHVWTQVAVNRVAQAREKFLAHARNSDKHYDFAFMVDDDVLVDPYTLIGLLRSYFSHQSTDTSNFCVLFAVFWTAGWDAANPDRELPQVWEQHPYGISEESLKFLSNIDTTTQLEVAGGGACTLFPRSVFMDDEPLYHPPIQGLQHWGEDRWACLRLAQRGIKLLAIPGHHIYHAYSSEQRDPDNVLFFMWQLGYDRFGYGLPPSTLYPTAPVTSSSITVDNQAVQSRPDNHPRLKIAMPTYTSVHPATTAALILLAGQWSALGGNVGFITMSSPLVALARDELTQAMVMQEDLRDEDLILWLDSDMSFDPDDLYRALIRTPLNAVVGVCARQKRPDIIWCGTPRPEWQPPQDWPKELQHLVWGNVGGACMMMRAKTLRMMHHLGRKYIIPGKELSEVWMSGVFKTRNPDNPSEEKLSFVGEDIGFCLTAESYGIATLIDPTILIHHHDGRATYSGRLSDGEGMLQESRPNPFAAGQPLEHRCTKQTIVE